MRAVFTLAGVGVLATASLLLSGAAMQDESAPLVARQAAGQESRDVDPRLSATRTPRLGATEPQRDQEPADAAPTLDPTLVDACLDVAEQIDPELADRLRHLCAEDQEAFERVMRTHGRRLVGLVDLRERDPELYEQKLTEMRFESQVSRAVRELREAQREGSQGQIDAATDELRILLRMQVALSIKARGDYIRRLEEHIESLREDLERDVAGFDEAVDRRLQRYLKSTAPGHPADADEASERR